MLRKEILKMLFGEKLRSEHDIADFDRIYFTNGQPEIKNTEDLLDYILNFAGYYNLRLPNDKRNTFDNMGIMKYIQKKYNDRSLLSEEDLDKEYGIFNAHNLLAHVGRGVITCPNCSMLLQAKYKPLFYQALLRDRLNTKIYKMTNVRPWKNDANIKLRTSEDCMQYMMKYCISNGLIIYDRQESADFINYLEKLHKEGRLLNGTDIERHIKAPRLGAKLLKQYWASGTKKSINFIRNNNVCIYLPIDNLDDFLTWLQGCNNKVFQSSSQEDFIKNTKAAQLEIDRVYPSQCKNDIAKGTSAKKLSNQYNDEDMCDKDIYSLTDQEIDALALKLAKHSYMEERNAVNAMLNYMGMHVFSEK